MQMSETEELQHAVDRILRSTSPKKLIVAGPGAGKTFLFKKLLEKTAGGPDNRLALTFINELKDDLDRNLSHLAGVYTLHGYCHYLLRRNRVLRTGLTASFDYFPDIPTLIKRDWELANGNPPPQFVTLMRDLQIGVETDFYLSRSDYYDGIGYDDSVFRVHARLSENPDQLSEYEMILVDEFQDFNRLESSFIDLLSSKSPIVIAGDDDQALYSQLRSSNPDFIRALHSAGEFEVFQLPFCMRCPAAIVDAVNAVVTKAQRQGCLRSRIKKPFRHYSPLKGPDSKRYPFIQSVQCSAQSLKANYFGRYIADAIRNIPKEEINESHEKLFPTVLIIGSIQYLRQIKKHLEEVGFSVQEKEETVADLSREDGLKRLKMNPESNLGWRIVVETDRPEWERKIVRESVQTSKPLCQLLPANFRIQVLTEAAEMDVTLEAQNPKPALAEDKEKPVIKLTSFEGSKGLSAQHVFVVGVHKGELPRDDRNIKDLEICKFIVSLTRTRKQCHVITTFRWIGVSKRPSIFVDWLPTSVTRIVKITKETVAKLC